jgi:hypothetical protein
MTKPNEEERQEQYKMGIKRPSESSTNSQSSRNCRGGIIKKQKKNMCRRMRSYIRGVASLVPKTTVAQPSNAVHLDRVDQPVTLLLVSSSTTSKAWEHLHHRKIAAVTPHTLYNLD